MKKVGKKIQKDTPPTERHLGALLESMDKKMDFLVEGHVAHTERFDRLEKKVDEKFSEVDYKFGVVLDELNIIRN